MPRIQPLAVERADARTAATLNAVKAKLGMIPNLISTFALSPAALTGYLQLSEALAGGRLSARQREIVALAVAQANGCHYCLAAHSAIGSKAGLTDEELRRARAGSAVEQRDAVIAAFARRVAEERGRLSSADLQAATRDGLDDGLKVEIAAHVALNVLTNYTNNLADTEVDFPEVDLAAVAA